MNIRLKKGFSAQETLVVLVIVVIVGSLIIVSLFHNAQTRETVTQLKKVYMSFNNSYNVIKMNEGAPDAWLKRGDNYRAVYHKIFSKYMDLLPMELPAGMNGLVIYGLNGTMEYYIPKEELIMNRLADGTIIRFSNITPNCRAVHGRTNALKSVCAEMFVQIKDINGNTNITNSILGKNTFVFYLTKEGFVPVGTKGSKEDAAYMCRKNKEMQIKSSSCTAWALQKENLNYLTGKIEW